MKRTIIRLGVIAVTLSALALVAPQRAVPTEAAGPGTWTAGGSLAQGRRNHTTTLLPSGQVLVMGGYALELGVSSVLSDAELYSPATNSWTLTTPLPMPLETHTATLLRDGRVLVVGGSGPVGIQSNKVFLFDPGTATWSNAADLHAARAFHKAVLLADGRVLVHGGFVEPTDEPGAEVYDPISDAWTVVTSTAGWGPLTLTLLPDGRVLSAGGWGSTSYAGSVHAELFDPSTNTWSAARDMATGRGGATATMLPTGKVLVVGGWSGDSTLLTFFASSELYDPATNAWTPAASMSFVRSDHTATLLGNGLLLVTGGGNPIGTAELYDPILNAWSLTASLSPPRRDHTATLLSDGRVLVMGGYDLTGPGMTSTELYDPTRWRAVAPPVVPRMHHSATLLQNGKVLVAGGGSASAEMYDEATNTWSPAGTMSAPREGHSAALLKDGRVLVVGGSNGPNNGSNHLFTAEVYDPGTNSWSAAASPTLDHLGDSAVLLADGRVLLYGGGVDAEPEVYNPMTDNWAIGATNPYAGVAGLALRTSAGRVVSLDLGTSSLYSPQADTWMSLPYSGPFAPGTGAQLEGSTKIVMTGGNGVCPMAQLPTSPLVEIFDGATETWSSGAFMTTSRSIHTASPLYDGRLLVAGGVHSVALCLTNPTVTLASAELYNLSSNTWNDAGSMTAARAYHTATRLPSGNVLMVGGKDDVAVVPSSELYDTGINTDTDGDGYNDGLEAALGQHPFLNCVAMRADTNYDGLVNSGDALRVAVEFGKRPPRARVDQNADKIINSGDQLRVAVNFGKRVLQCA